MFVPFQEISDHSRVWIYQADRKLNENEVEEISQLLMEFLESWSAHGKNLYCSSQIFYNQFLVIALDEEVAAATGCSIDASVHYIKELEQRFNLNFFDRSKVAFKDEEGVTLESMSELKNKIKEGSITEKHVTFNNLVKSKSEFDQNWEVEAGNSWIARFF